MGKKRFLELLAMLMIGDGVLTLLFPRRHCLLWQVGPQPYRKLMEELVQRPNMTRLLGALQGALSVWLASRQGPR